MKKVVGLAAAGLLAVSAANAGNFGTAFEDITLFGGIGAGWYNDRADFSITTLAVGLTHPVSSKSPVGFTVAIADFGIPVVHLDNEVLRNPFGGGDVHDFDLYLGYFSLMLVEGVTLDAGLLWQNFGNAPVTILNPHITRPVAFVAQPVLFAGARVNFDLGGFKAYLGINDGSALGGAHGGGVTDNGYEAGIKGDLGTVKVSLDYFKNDDSSSTINATAAGDVGGILLALEINRITDIPGTTDDLTTVALKANFDLGSIKLPVRIEKASDYVDVTTLTVTPTWHPTKNSFVRADLILRSGDDKEDSHNLIAEFGYLF
ncbi:MAG: outer membrane beta-barrel protein [Aquificae bacterium]|nr:outer membrane beta-barrel protein [Aquificota bacterium]